MERIRFDRSVPPGADHCIDLGRCLGWWSHVVAYTTHTPDCLRYRTSCPPEIIALPAQDFYVRWVLTRTGQPARPHGWETAT
jgi:hypothetical protein